MGLSERRLKEKEKRRGDILVAARSLLLSRGHRSISMRQIAALAKLGLGTIYFYFKSKEEIFAALSEEAFDVIHGAVSGAAAGGGDPVRRLKMIGRALLDLSESDKTYYDFIDYFISSPDIIFPDSIKAQVDLYGGKIIEPIAAVISRGVDSGKFRKIDPFDHALIFISCIRGFIHFKKLNRTILKNKNFRGLFAMSIDCFLKGISR